MSKNYDFVLEKFKSVYDFNNALKTRPNSELFKDEHSSEKHTDWSGTENYEKSEKLLAQGWKTKVEEIKAELVKYSQTVERMRVKHKASMAGFAPIIPAAVKGVPKAMWSTTQKKKLEKRNYLHIYFNNTGSASEDADDLMKSGIAILKLCILLEKTGIKTKIDILPFIGNCGDSIYGCCVAIKDYKQPFNLLKMAYPIAHTSVFRRQGFKWLETSPDTKNSSFPSGYGRPLKYADENIREAFYKYYGLKEDGSVYITYYDCQDCNYEPEAIAEKFGLAVPEKN